MQPCQLCILHLQCNKNRQKFGKEEASHSINTPLNSSGNHLETGRNIHHTFFFCRLTQLGHFQSSSGLKLGRIKRCAAPLRKRASTYTDGGMLWWVPPTSVTRRVEKSKSRHAHHALETTQLRSTCILGKKYPPYAHSASFGLMLPPWIFFFPPENPKMKTKRGEKMEVIKSHLC